MRVPLSVVRQVELPGLAYVEKLGPIPGVEALFQLPSRDALAVGCPLHGLELVVHDDPGRERIELLDDGEVVGVLYVPL